MLVTAGLYQYRNESQPQCVFNCYFLSNVTLTCKHCRVSPPPSTKPPAYTIQIQVWGMLHANDVCHMFMNHTRAHRQKKTMLCNKQN